METKVLSIIIPCYGKDNQVVDKSLDLVNKLLSKTNLIEVIFVYKNSEKYNYDWVKDKYSDFIVLKEERQDINKHYKQIHAINMSHGKYFYTVDPDDLVKEENILNFLEKLKEENNDLIVISHGIKLGKKYKHKNFIAKYKRNFGKVFFYNQVNIYKTEVVKNKSKDLLEYSDIFNKHSWFQDLLFPLWFLNKNSKLSFYNVELVDYVKGLGESSVLQNSILNENYFVHLMQTLKLINLLEKRKQTSSTKKFIYFCFLIRNSFKNDKNEKKEFISNIGMSWVKIYFALRINKVIEPIIRRMAIKYW